MSRNQTNLFHNQRSRRNWRGLASLSIVVGVFVCGCPASNSGGDESVELRFDADGPIAVDANSSAMRVVSFDISAQLPQQRVGSIEISLVSPDIQIDSTGGSNVQVRIGLTVADQNAIDTCSSGIEVASFDVSIESNSVRTIAPETVTVTTAGLSTFLAGQFSGCLTVSSDAAVTLTIQRFTLAFLDPAPIAATSCEQVLALPAVQNALTRSGSNGFLLRFPTPTATGPPTGINGSFDLDQDTTFDPDGANVGDTEDGSVRLTVMPDATVRRDGFGGFVDFFTSPAANSIGFCTVARTNNPVCDQTVARIEALAIDPDTGVLTGRFLAVSVRREQFTDPLCGDDGDFIFGNLTLTPRVSQTLLDVGAPIALTAQFDPDLLIVSPTGAFGVVTDVDSDDIVRFSTTSPSATTPIPLPQDLSGAAGFSALGVSSNGDRLAVVTDQPDASVSYDLARLTTVVRQTASTSADYIGARVDFSPDASRIFVPTTDTQFADRITVLRTDNSTFADEVRRLFTPQGRVPVRAKLSPNGLQLAELLEAGAPIGLAGELVLINADTGNILQRINLTTAANGSVLATELVYSADGSMIFLAGLGGVVAIQTQSPFAVTTIDVSGGNGDDPSGLALSGDGAVLAVSVAANNGTTDFAIISTDTLRVEQTFDLESISAGDAVAVAHFGGERLAVVAASTDHVVAIQTQPPFMVGDPADVSVMDGGRIGEIASGGNVIALTNVSDRSVYILRPQIAPSSSP